MITALNCEIILVFFGFFLIDLSIISILCSLGFFDIEGWNAREYRALAWPFGR
jgi:hypothetical protein